MIIITTHLNADFDCLGAMIGVKKIYPNAEIVFPGSKEPAMRKFLKSGYFSLEEKKMKDVNFSKVKKIILVDTQNLARLGKITEFIKKRRKLEMECIDHHPESDQLMKDCKKRITPVGSTTTILISILREKNIPIDPLEATVMALGIYEDTGFLLFPTTTPSDLSAAAYLLGCGADLRVVSSILKRGLSSEQIVLYNDLLKSSRTYNVKGEEVVISLVRKEKYIPDAAIVVHQICDSENIPHFFALISMEDRIFLIGRSKIPSLNAGKVAEHFGGGGHSSAASATIKEITLMEAKDKLYKIIRETLSPIVKAKDAMSKIVLKISSRITIEKALEYMNKFRVNALPIAEKGEIIGAVTRQMIDMAIYHNLAKTAVKEIVLENLEIIPEDSDLSEIQKIIIEKNLKFVLVGKSRGKIKGIITRMALFRNLYENQVKKDRFSLTKLPGIFTEHIKPMMERRFPKHVSSLLKKAGKVADEMGVDVYLVGGMVRDLILNEENIDIDLVVEGNGIAYAEKLGKVFKGKVRSHDKFQTAVVLLQNDLKIDIASSRMEYYDYPGALPTVERGMIRQDLYRRDFTINTLAIKVNKSDYGTLVDYFGGRKDLKENKIRVIHGLSFIEDPTRAYRAIRFANRLGFEIANETKNLIRTAIKKGIFERLTGRRILKELILIFDDEHPVKTVKMLESFGLLEFIAPPIKLTKTKLSLLYRIEEVLSWYRLLYRSDKPENYIVYLMGLADSLEEKARLEMVKRLGLRSKDQIILTEYPKKIHKVVSTIQKNDKIKNSDIYYHVRDLSLETVLFLIAKVKKIELKKAFTSFLLDLREIKLEINGKDLKALGLAPSPEFSRIFNTILRAKIDGRIKDKHDELKMAKKLVEKRRKSR